MKTQEQKIALYALAAMLAYVWWQKQQQNSKSTSTTTDGYGSGHAIGAHGGRRY